MDRAQCLIVRENKILTVKHRQHNIEYFCEFDSPRIGIIGKIKGEDYAESNNKN